MYIYIIKQTEKHKAMLHTAIFTEEHENELKRIATLNVFASKIAQTILSKENYKASFKQVEVIEQESSLEFYPSDDYLRLAMNQNDVNSEIQREKQRRSAGICEW